MEKEKLNIKLSEETKELVIREGKALDPVHLKPVKLDGTISAPGKFIKERNSDFEKNKSHCIIKREIGSISLVLNEQGPIEHYYINGMIKVGSKFEELGINIEQAYTPEKLSRKLKFLRSIFVNKGNHAEIVAKLRNLKAKVNQEISKDDDQKGNVKMSFTQAVESNIPESFKISLPLLEGEKSKQFDVEVILEADSSHNIKCYLESIDASEMLEEEINKRIDEEIKIISKYAVIIES